MFGDRSWNRIAGIFTISLSIFELSLSEAFVLKSRSSRPSVFRFFSSFSFFVHFLFLCPSFLFSLTLYLSRISSNFCIPFTYTALLDSMNECRKSSWTQQTEWLWFVLLSCLDFQSMKLTPCLLCVVFVYSIIGYGTTVVVRDQVTSGYQVSTWCDNWRLIGWREERAMPRPELQAVYRRLARPIYLKKIRKRRKRCKTKICWCLSSFQKHTRKKKLRT